MLSLARRSKLQRAINAYRAHFSHDRKKQVDKPGRLRSIDGFLADVLEYAPMTEIRTGQRTGDIRADRLVQVRGVRQFLVMVIAMAAMDRDERVRRAVQCGAEEGVDWVLLTDGREFDLYRVRSIDPAEARLVFSIDLRDADQDGTDADVLQYLHRNAAAYRGLEILWKKTIAMDPQSISNLISSTPVINYLQRALRIRYKSVFTKEEVLRSVQHVLKVAVPRNEDPQRTSNGSGAAGSNTAPGDPLRVRSTR